MFSKKHIARYILNRILLSVSLLKIVPSLFMLIEAEAKLAGRDLLATIVLYFIALMLLCSVWISLLAFLFLYLVSLNISSLLSMLVILSLNIFLLLIIYLIILKRKNQSSFPKTREVMKSLRG